MSTPAPPDAGPAGPAVPSSDAVLPVTAALGGAAGAPAALSAPPTDTTKKRKRPPLCRGLDEFAQEKLLGSGTFGYAADSFNSM